jgi:superfamily II DNA or RNA helicase
MGLGKSILAIAIAIDNMDKYAPVMLLTKSLQENMKDAIRKYVKLRAQFDADFHLCKLTDEELTAWINKHFDFVSLNASNMLQQMARIGTSDLEQKMGSVLALNSLEGKMLIVDEAHNLFRAITNGSKNGMGLYEAVINSKNLKVMFLTGTPIASNPFELVSCFNMLGSKRFRNLPEDYNEFVKLYVNADGTINNKEKFQNRIMGLVSSVNHLSKPGSAIGHDEEFKVEFPEELPLIVEYCKMTRDQYAAYQLAKDKEAEETQNKKGVMNVSPMTKPKSRSSSSYKVHSRQISNFVSNTNSDASDTAADWSSPKFERLLKNIDANGNLGLVYSQYTGMGGLAPLVKYLEANGWENVVKSPTQAQDKFIVEHVEKLGSMDWWHDGTEEFDIGDVVGAAEPFDISRVLGGSTKYFAVYTGEMDVLERRHIVEMFNSDSNMHGGRLDLLLVSSVGAEGLDLKNIRHVHILEPYWTWGRIAQVISRGVRNDSHIKLPADEKNVQPYIYIAISPDDPNIVTTDVELYQEALKEMNANKTFIEALQEVSIECSVNGCAKCRVCNPTNRPLITQDASYDARATDPCQEVVKKEVSAKSVVVDGVTYYYVKSTESVYGWNVYVLDPKISVHIPLAETDPAFEKVIEKISA